MESINEITITAVTSAQTIPKIRGSMHEMRNRRAFGLSFCRSGQITYTMNGIRTVSDRMHAVLLPRYGNYALHCDETGIFPLITFQSDNFQVDKILSFPLSNPKSFLIDYDRLEKLLLFPGNRLKAIGLMYEILSRLSQSSTGRDGILLPAVQYLKTNYTDPALCNKTLADCSGISEVYFRRMFTTLYGTTPKQYICDIRIQRAKQLLSEGQLSVTEVSEACGFSGIQQFCRAFKQRTGMTPLEYANRSLQLGL